MNQDTVVFLFGCALATVVGWVIPIRYGIQTARAKGYSPRWMWFGIHPALGWIALIVFACLPRRHQCHNCGGFLGSHFRICPYCRQEVDPESEPMHTRPLHAAVTLCASAPATTPKTRPVDFSAASPAPSPAPGLANVFFLTVGGLFLVLVVLITIVTSLGTSASTTFSKVGPTLDHSVSSPLPNVIDPEVAERAEIESGFRLIRSEQFDEVLRRANAMIANGALEPAPYLLRAEVRFKSRDYVQAESDYSIAITMLEGRSQSAAGNTLLAWCLRSRVSCYTAMNSPDRAWIDINKVIALNPQDGEAMNCRGALRETFYQDYRGALDDYASAMSLSPKETVIQANHLRMSRKLGN